LYSVEHGTCQPGFKKFDKFCYQFKLWDKQPWSIARFRCNKAGGDLVSILNQQEKDFLIYQLKELRWHSWVWTGKYITTSSKEEREREKERGGERGEGGRREDFSIHLWFLLLPNCLCSDPKRLWERGEGKDGVGRDIDM